MVAIAESARAVELPLDAAEIAGVARVLVVARLLTEEIIRHVFHRIETQAIGLGSIHFPPGGTDQVCADIFDEGRLVGIDVFLCLESKLLGSGTGTKFFASLIDQHAKVGHISIFVLIVLRGSLEIADERVLRMIVVHVRPVVGVRGLVGDVDEVGETEVLNFPRTIPVARVVPLAIKSVFGAAKVEIFRHHAGVHLDRCVLVISRHIEGPVVHDVVEINANAKAVRHFHQIQQVGLRPVTRAHGVALILRTEVEGIPEVIADRQSAGAFGRWWQPQGRVSCLDQFGHLVRDFGPAGIKILQQGLTAGKLNEQAEN